MSHTILGSLYVVQSKTYKSFLFFLSFFHTLSVWIWNMALFLMHGYAQSCPALCNPMDCSPPGPSVHGIFQGRILEWVAMPSSRGSSRPMGQRILCLLHWQADSLPTVPHVEHGSIPQLQANMLHLTEGTCVYSRHYWRFRDVTWTGKRYKRGLNCHQINLFSYAEGFFLR